MVHLHAGACHAVDKRILSHTKQARYALYYSTRNLQNSALACHPANLSRQMIGHDIVVLGEVGVVGTRRKEFVGSCRRYARGVTTH